MTPIAAVRGGKVAAIILAAGGSQRLGTPKQLVRYHGQPLVMRAVKAARSALPKAPLLVVVGANAARIRLAVRRADPRAQIVPNGRWRHGMATSLHAGMRRVPHTAQAVLLLVTDQPLVTAAALKRLVAAWRRRPGTPAAALYEGRAGVPAIVPRRRWHALKALRADQGARALLRGSAMVTLVDMPEARLDVDTPADVRRLILRA